MALPKAYLVQMRDAERYHWWKPIPALILAFVFYCLLITALILAAWQFAGFDSAVDLSQGTEGFDLQQFTDSLDSTDPVVLGTLCGSIICMLPCTGLALKIFGLGGIRGLSSVEGHLRWNSLARLMLPMLAVFALGIAAEVALASFLGGGAPAFQLPSLELLLVILILVPLQSLTEEYVYRGAIMQILGSWIPLALIPLVLQALLFMASHGYNLYGLIGTGVFGLMAGIIVLQTGGLEAAISIHAANNMCTFLASALIVGEGSALAGDVTLMNLAFMVVLHLAGYIIVWRISRKHGWLAQDSAPKPQHFRRS